MLVLDDKIRQETIAMVISTKCMSTLALFFTSVSVVAEGNGSYCM